jgi:hypothetical protein
VSTEAAQPGTDDIAALSDPRGTLVGSDLFSLGRQASAAREALFGRRASFVRARELRGPDLWHGPRDAAESAVDEVDLAAVGGIEGARRSGATMLISRGDLGCAREAAAAGLRVLWRVEYRAGEPEAERIERLVAARELDHRLWGLLPAPVGEPYGLDTLRFFGLCRLLAPTTAGWAPHVVADVTSLGPRLAQMAFGFGADELRAQIVAERALRLGANANNPALTRKEAATLIRGAGLVPCERMADGRLEEVVA